jgi:4-hydroxythreonine-4-phosphate dehydrogenase
VAKPVVAISMGDPAGIGPELVVKVLAQMDLGAFCSPLLIGDAGVIAENVRRLGANLRLRPTTRFAEARFDPAEIDVLCPAGVCVERIPWGTLDPAMGKVAALCLQQAYELALAGQVQGVAAAPMNKQAFHLAGYNYFDEVAFLVDITHSRDAYILGATDSFWTVAVSEHTPFTRIAAMVKKERILSRTRGLHDGLRRGGWPRPRLAVAALNVHGGEGGLFGREEIDEIAPAIELARGEGIDVVGPLPADTVFVRAREGEFDGVVCMYHDQANIARKLVSTRRGASIFMGLPVVCATTAHGTAFDKAGLGVAEIGSMEAALTYAARLAVAV